MSRNKPLGLLVSLLLVACSNPGSRDTDIENRDILPDLAPRDVLVVVDVPLTADELFADAGLESLDGPSPSLPGQLNLATDADRDGKVSFTDPDDEAFEDSWSMKGGAVFLLNLDDDDGDGLADALDDKVNGPEDTRDLAPIYLAAASWLPDGVTVILSGTNTDKGRLFRFGDDGWLAVTLPYEVPVEGLRDDPLVLGFEGRDISLLSAPELPSRIIELRVTATGPGGVELAGDRVELHVAPLLITSALQPVKQAFLALPQDGSLAVFDQQLGELLAAAGLPLSPVALADEEPVFLGDHLELALGVLPRAGGHVTQHYALLAGPEPMVAALEQALLGADLAPLVPLTGSPFELYHAFSNLESSPVLLAGEMYFPYGRLYYGTGPAPGSMPATGLLSLLERQGLQGSPVAVDTSFLHTGHVSEIISWVPYTGDPGCCGKGFRMLYADPELALNLLGDVVDMETIAYNLALVHPLAESYASFLPQLGLEDEDVIRVPVLFVPHPVSGRASPLLPSIANGIPVGKHYLAPGPAGIVPDFEVLSAWLMEALAPINAVVTFLPMPDPVAGIYRTVVTRRLPDNVEWWLWFM